MITVGRLAPGNQWDQNTLDLLFSNKLYPTTLNFQRVTGYPDTQGCILIIPGRYWASHEQSISEALSPYEWVLGMRTSDEADLFNIHAVQHPNLRWWVQTPRTDRDYGAARLFGVGFPPHFNNLPTQPDERQLDVFLAGQDTNDRRHEAFQQLRSVRGNTQIQPTPGFTKGMPPAEYAQTMVDAKVAPAPSGPHTPDMFRLYEALEAHCVPIADDITVGYPSHGYWRMLFPDCPFPVLTDYPSLPDYVDTALSDWPANSNRVAAWWMRQKRTMTHWLEDDLKQLGAL